MKLNILFEEKLPKSCVVTPNVRQVENYSCGAACTLCVLRYFGVDESCSERDLYEPLGTDNSGTDRKDIVKVFKEYGLEAEMKSGASLEELKDWVSPTQLALVCLQAWEDKEEDPVPLEDSMNDGHYIVFVGFDKDRLYFMDPAMDGGKFGFISSDDFVERWHDVSPSGERQEHQTIFVSGKDPKNKETKRPKVAEIE